MCFEKDEKMYSVKTGSCELLVHAKNLDARAREQIEKVVTHPALHGLVAIMPDAHAGAGCVIGFTGKFRNAVIPNIVGVDIGCGVLTYPLHEISEIDFPRLDAFIREQIPLGMNSRIDGSIIETDLAEEFRHQFTSICKHIEEGFFQGNKQGRHIPASHQIGTLGGGNHFIEIDRSESGTFFVTIHSGSRNFGKRVADHYQELAQTITQEMGVEVPRGLEYLPLAAGGNQYMQWARIAQTYAQYNRRMMLMLILHFFGRRFDKTLAVESVHNYISPEDNLIRKGAIAAYKDQKVVIPLNMADGTIIGIGKSKTSFNNSAPHGAGRVFGRMEMFRKLDKGEFSLDNYQRSMAHVFTTSLSRETFDESKFAYKPLADIQDYLSETVDILEIMKPVYNLKAQEEG